MCGIFGAIGNWSEGTIRGLAIVNRERGKDSLGFFDSSGMLIKGAGDPLTVLSQDHLNAWLRGDRKKAQQTIPKGWFMAGHTRLGTRGAAVRRNAHPFRYGKIVGAHNGMIDAPRDYEVDSMYLFDLLNKHGGDYNKALGDLTGYWGLSWFDGKDFYLQCHDGELSMVHTGDCWYYSSDDTHLKACVQCDHDQIITFAEGETWKFSSDGEVVACDPFVSTAAQYWTKGGQYSRYTSYDHDYGAGITGDKSAAGGDSRWWDDDEYKYKSSNSEDVKDFDEEWRTAWSQYTTDSEHAVT